MGRKGVIWRLAGAPSGVRFKTNNWKSKQNYFLNVPPPYWSKTYLGRKYIFAKKELIFSRFFASILPNFVWDFFWLTATQEEGKRFGIFPYFVNEMEMHSSYNICSDNDLLHLREHFLPSYPFLISAKRWSSSTKVPVWPDWANFECSWWLTYDRPNGALTERKMTIDRKNF